MTEQELIRVAALHLATWVGLGVLYSLVITFLARRTSALSIGLIWVAYTFALLWLVFGRWGWRFEMEFILLLTLGVGIFVIPTAVPTWMARRRSQRIPPSSLLRDSAIVTGSYVGALFGGVLLGMVPEIVRSWAMNPG